MTIKRNEAQDVKYLKRFVKGVNDEAHVGGNWDMGKVRSGLAKGWPAKQKVPGKLGTNALGGMQWWYAVGESAQSC